jgi:hypothetical protein
MYVGRGAAAGGLVVVAQPSSLELLSLPALGQGLQVSEGLGLPWGREDWIGTSDVLASPATGAGDGDLWVLRHQAGLLQLSAAAAQARPLRRTLLPFVALGPRAVAAPTAEGTATVPASSGTAACAAPTQVLVIADGTGRLGEGVNTGLRHWLRRGAGQPLQRSLALVDRQGRRAGLAGWPDANVGPWLPPLGPDAAEARLDLGLAAAWRGQARSTAGHGRRVILVAAPLADSVTASLASRWAATLRAAGTDIRAVWPAWSDRPQAGEVLARLAGAVDRVSPLGEVVALGPLLERLTADCAP